MYSHAHNYKLGEHGAVLGIVVNIVLFFFKLFAGIMGRSTAMIADAIHTASDFLTSVVVFVGFKIAQKPPDLEHPYGHGRAESIAAKIVSLLLIFLGIRVFWHSVHVITSQDVPEPGYIALIAAVVSIVAKFAVYRVVKKLGNT